jgi:hypothetical protein
MYRIAIFFFAVLGSTLAHDEQTEGESAMPQGKVETMVCIRHGEKPLLGLGQLTCRGLNRALALFRYSWRNSASLALSSPDPNQVANDLGASFVMCGL